MASKAFSYRLPDAAVQALEALQLEGETLNQTAQRFMLEHLGLSTDMSAKLSTSLHTSVDSRLEDVEKTLAELRSHFEAQQAQLEELRGKSKAR